MSWNCRVHVLTCLMILELMLFPVHARTELVVNGGFESGLNGWKPYVYDDVYGRVNITQGTSRSGSWSLRTYIDPARESPYTQKRGGGVAQTLPINIKGLDVVFSFWVMPAVVGDHSYTNIRALIRLELKDGKSLNFFYHVAWAPTALGESLYNTSDTTIFFLPAMLHQWSYVQREIKRDFESRYGSSDAVVLSGLRVSFEMTTVSHLTTPDAFWDDISVVAETQPTTPSPTPTTTPTVTPTSPQQPSPTLPSPTTSPPVASPTERTGAWDSLVERYWMSIVLGVVVVALALVALRRRPGKSVKMETVKRYCLSCGAELAVGSEYCTRCGAKQ